MHSELDPKDKDFWSFGWAEMGLYDLPANIDLIKSKTGAEKVHYLGH